MTYLFQIFPCLKSRKCQKMFKTDFWLKRHIDNKHSDIVQHVCEYCLKIFAHMASLRGHIRKQHKGDEDGFQCDQCDIKTTTRQDLKRHRLNEHVPRKCLKCQKILPTGLVWRLHRKTCTKSKVSQGNLSIILLKCVGRFILDAWREFGQGRPMTPLVDIQDSSS